MPVPRTAPHVLDLAKKLGTRIGLAQGAIMERYRVLVDIVERGMEEVPWLAAGSPASQRDGSKAGKKGQTKGRGGGKMKVETKDKTEGGKRGVVAKAVVDVVQFREEVWRRRILEGGRVELDTEGEGPGEADSDTLDLGLEDENQEGEGGDGGGTVQDKGAGTNVQATVRGIFASNRIMAKVATDSRRLKRKANTDHLPQHNPPSLIARKPPKRPRSSRTLAESFLLSPLSSPYPSSTPSAPVTYKSKPPSTTTRSKSQGQIRESLSLSIEHTTHLLAPDVSLTDGAPSRLQLLVAMRGGEQGVEDEELFEEGELEGMLVGLDSAPDEGVRPRGRGEGEDGDEDEEAPKEGRPEEDEMRDRRGVLWALWGTEGHIDTDSGSQSNGSQVQTGGRKGPPKPRGRERLNIEALSQLFRDDDDAMMGIEGLSGLWSLDGEHEKYEEGQFEDDSLEYGDERENTDMPVNEGDVEVSDWRPASPGGTGGGWDDRFDV